MNKTKTKPGLQHPIIETEPPRIDALKSWHHRPQLFLLPLLLLLADEPGLAGAAADAALGAEAAAGLASP